MKYLLHFQENSRSFFTIIFVSLFAVVVITNAWVTDDAYIVFRTVDNFVNGYGLTWNTGERVQVYTNPLWMFLHSAVYFVTNEIYYSTIFISTAVSLIAILLFALKIARTTTMALLGITILTFSKAFIDYSTSGMENPMTHLILALFFFIYFKFESSSTKDFRTFFLLSLIAAMGAFNRPDTILLFLPSLVYALLRLRSLRGVYALTMGFLPFIAWEGFTLFYYGDLLANPSYSKVLSTGISRIEYAEQGLYYVFVNPINIDPLTLLIIVSGIAIPFLTKEWRSLPIVAGISLYLLFVVMIGGDFMTGRLLTAPLFCAVIVLSRNHFISSKFGDLSSHNFKGRFWVLPFFVVIFLSLASPYSPFLNDADYGKSAWDKCIKCTRDKGISDQRLVYYLDTGLFNAEHLQWGADVEMPNHLWRVQGERARDKGVSLTDPKVAVGFYGFAAGPKVHLADRVGVTDPLLARLPSINKFSGDPNFRIGHIFRMIPAGYLETLESGENKIVDKDLALYYDKLSLITRGDLFDSNRISEIINMNLGKYDHHIDAYAARYSTMLHLELTDIDQPKVEGTRWDASSSIVFFSHGIEISLGREYSTEHIEISFTTTTRLYNDKLNDEYQIVYLKENEELAKQDIPTHPIRAGRVHIVNVPLGVVEEGYDSIRIIPIRGDHMYSIGQIRLLTDEILSLDFPKTIFVSVGTPTIGHNDEQSWSVKGLPANAGYETRIGWTGNVLITGKGTADGKGEASGSFLVGEKIPAGTITFRVALASDPDNFGEVSMNINP
ncbi:MAG: hypothetical protein ACE5J2_08630 [Nitrososphaerales archaeon]